ncbi:MAG TPA: hypothetical protein DCF33_22260 [Saprospirales bacterium]|nr:hypothetical protein [Saprospirales bacterium]
MSAPPGLRQLQFGPFFQTNRGNKQIGKPRENRNNSKKGAINKQPLSPKRAKAQITKKLDFPGETVLLQVA